MGDGEVHVKLGLDVLLTLSVIYRVYIENYFLRSDGVGSRLCLNMYIVDESCIELWIAMFVLLLVGSSLLTPFSSLVRCSSS